MLLIDEGVVLTTDIRDRFTVLNRGGALNRSGVLIVGVEPPTFNCILSKWIIGEFVFGSTLVLNLLCNGFFIAGDPPKIGFASIFPISIFSIGDDENFLNFRISSRNDLGCSCLPTMFFSSAEDGDC